MPLTFPSVSIAADRPTGEVPRRVWVTRRRFRADERWWRALPRRRGRPASRRARGRRSPTAWPPSSPLEAARDRQFERGVLHVHAEREPEEIDLDALLPCGEDPEKAEHGHLGAGAARARAGQRGAGQEVLADRGRRQVQAQLGDGAADVCDERVAVRTRPRAVAGRVGIRRDRRLDLRDQLVYTLGLVGRPEGRGGCRTSSCRVRPDSRGRPARRGRRPTPRPRSACTARRSAGFSAIHVCTASTPRQPTVRAAYTCRTGSDVVAGSGDCPDESRRSSHQLPPARPSAVQPAAIRSAARTSATLLRRIAERRPTDAPERLRDVGAGPGGRSRARRGRLGGAPPASRCPISSPPPWAWQPASSPSSPSLQRASSFSWGAL